MARWFVDRQAQKGIPSVSLRRLLKGASFEGCPDWDVSGCSDDHRRLDPGQVFVAVRSDGYDGHSYIREALERGAAGVVVERPSALAGRLQVVVADSRAAHARICHALAGDPARSLRTIGVTGTFGKTVAGLLLRSILDAAGYRCGLVGPLGWSDGLTTRPIGAGFGPGAAGLASMLGEMVDRGCDAGVVEFSGAALEQRGAEGIELRAAVVTDVSAPFGFPAEAAIKARRAKAKLVRQVAPGGAVVVNADDPHAELLGAVNLDARRVTFGIDRPADVTARIDRLDPGGSRFRVLGFDREIAVESRLIGRRQVVSALAAAAAAWSLGIGPDAVAVALEGSELIAGRLEAINEGQDFDVRIDDAQTAEELYEVLTTLRGISGGRIHCVLSGEGGREIEARRLLASAAERAADRLIVTLGNPRSEDPNRIIDGLLGGLRRPGKALVQIDRARAIEAALADARPGDTVLIAGKGRHTFQILADRIVHFDDAATARGWLRSRRARRHTA
jgi:UDP-N-acetylmuramoyl-L-alanyl-D-glutamate--2,6-diaminopimelate ligase